MSFSIRKNWSSTFELIVSHPQLLIPFALIAFLEAIGLEILYFIPRNPFVNLMGPIIRKFYGEAFLHYPGNLYILPKLFYYAQIVVYVIAGVVLSAVTVNMVKNYRTKVAVNAKALANNAAKRYPAYLLFGILVIALSILIRRADTFLFHKSMIRAAAHFPQLVQKAGPIALMLTLFFAHVLLNTLMILTIPILVIKRSSLIRAVGESLHLGIRYFFTVFATILVPYALYLPVLFLKSFPVPIANQLFPEMVLVITAIGIVVSLFVECFIIVSITQLFMERSKKGGWRLLITG